MKPQTFQHPEIRDENDNIIQPGAFGKNTPFCTKGNDGIFDYIANDLEYLYKNGGSGGGQGIQGPKGDPGPRGEPGQKGADGKDGVAATIKIGTVTTVAPGTNAKITNTGTANAAVFNFSIPKGEKGEKGNTGIQGPPGPAADLSQYVKKTEIFDGNMIKLPNGAKIGVE